jgi:hypothetical protein
MCDDEPAVFNGLCLTCMDSGAENPQVGGAYVEKFKPKKSKKNRLKPRYEEDDYNG